MKYIKDKENFSILIFQDGANRVRKLKIVLAILSLGLCASALNNFLYYNVDVSIALLITVGIILTLYFFVSSDTTNIVAGILLWTITILASYLAWMNNALFDTAILIFPCILIFSSLLGGSALLYPLIIYMLVVLYFFVYAVNTGFLKPIPTTSIGLWGKANNIAIILLVCVFAIELISSYIKKLIKRLFDENKLSRKIKKQADQLILNDHLTQLPNDLSCHQELEEIILASQANDEIVGFISFNLNNLKWVNSSLGHEIGDKTISYLSGQLTTLINKRRRLYRCYGNEFIFIVTEKDYKSISDFSQQLVQSIYRPFQIDSYDIEVTCSVGISIAPFDGLSFQTLRQKSHMALSRARDDEPNSYKFFEIEMEEYVNNRLKMVHDLKQAISLQEFELFYQPKVDLLSNTIVGAEALIRWRKGGNELISPDVFIPAAEASGLISEIGQWVLEKSCIDCKQWHDKGVGNLTIAVNLSPIQFRRGSLPGTVFRALKQAELDPSFLELEITESLFIDNTEHISEQVYEIASKGISIAIDDFGTGYSNLNYLTKFNASTLKIDMSFITDMVQVEQKQHIVNAVIKMSKEMGLENVAEGIEDFETVEKLKQFKCQYGQGYYWSKPLPNNEFIELVQNHINN
ncbi:MAG: diguanylate cyclase (GGDEF)-like protein [Oleispira sp.]|jgi:diguanylate cyclase (GGDEF)-like protein